MGKEGSKSSSVRKTAMIVVSLVVLGVAVGLRLWTSGIYYRPLPTPAASLKLPGFLNQVCAFQDGLHFRCSRDPWKPMVGFQLGTHLTHVTYRHGCVLSFLGFTIAVLTRTFHGGDYVVSPHAALVLPYWFVILGAAGSCLAFSGMAKQLKRWCRFSVYSSCAMAVVLLTFLVLGCMPSAWRPGSAIIPSTWSQQMALIFHPTRYGEACLNYGFPFVCYTRGIIAGKTVDFFYGATLGLQQHKLMEDVCVAFAAGLAACIAVERLRPRAREGGAERSSPAAP